MRKLILVSVVVLFASISASAQTEYNTSSSYTTALGLKYYPGAITIKHFINSNTALEGLVYFWSPGVRITGLYEIYGNFEAVDGLKWYIGPGAHISFYNQDYGGGAGFGLDGVIGIDYKFEGAPINLSLDWQPSVEFGSNYNSGFTGSWGGLGVRYAF